MDFFLGVQLHFTINRNKQLKLICYKTGGIFSEGYECFWYTAGGNQNVPFGKRIGGKF